MISGPVSRDVPWPDEPVEAWHDKLRTNYRQLLKEVARLEAQWLLDERIRFALRNDRLP